jgi:endonuclease YncB( thermonuclease family)
MPTRKQYIPDPKLRTRCYQNCEILSETDGDTVDVLVDQGFDSFQRVRFRMAFINAPENGTPEGEKARDYLKTLLPVGFKCTVYSIKDKKYREKKEKYGRYLGIFVDAFGAAVHELLLESGNAKPYEK